MYFRQQSNGSILALSSVDSSVTELERSTEYARFVGMTLHQRTDVLYWSDGRSIRRRSVLATDGPATQVLIGTLAHVTWYGVNFGSTQTDIVEMNIKGTTCVSVLSWSPDKVECLVGLPLRYPTTAGDSVSVNADFIKAEDCKIQTTSGAMQGFALNYGEMRAAGYASPIVEHLDVRATFITPHALAVNDNAATDKTEEWLYWSNSADGKIYRSHLSSTRLEVVQENAWSVRGLAIGRLSSSEETTSSLYFSLESKGIIARIPLPSSPIAGALPNREVLLQGLESPRGIALDAVNQALYFAEKTGRIFKAKMLRDGVLSTATTGDNDSKSGPKLSARKVVALATMTRLDGLAVDSKCVVFTLQVAGLWTEFNDLWHCA